MREIKFRAWVSKGAAFGGRHEGMYTGFSFADIYSGRDEANVYCEFGPDGYNTIEEPQWGMIVLMQYTGLRDKDGVEIYEGDVVKLIAEWEEVETEFWGIVQWGDLWPEFYIKQTKGPVGECASAFYDPMGAKFAWENLEVIGNIYENPELVKEG